MPRISRKKLNSGFFHVLTQGINKEFIFKNDKYKEKYIGLIKKYLKEYKVTIIAYCIMTNHAHLLFFTEDVYEISKLMHKVNTDYARFFNSKENRVGYVFRDRFKSEFITDERYLRVCISYIHNNPVKAKMTVTPAEYKYSSYNDYKYNTNITRNSEFKKVFGSHLNDFLKVEEGLKKYDFMECYEEGVDDIIEEYKKNNNINDISQILGDKQQVEKMVKEIFMRTKASIRCINNKLHIGRNRLAKIRDNVIVKQDLNQ